MNNKKMYYLSMVRNIVSNIDTPRLLDNLRKHLSKSKISHGFYMTKEISPANNQLHIHTIISLKSIDESQKMIYFINTHHLKAYVDKVIKLRTDNGDEQSESKLLVRNAEMSKANRRIT